MFDAVDARSATDPARQKELATVSETLAAYWKHEVVWVRFPGAPDFNAVVDRKQPGKIFVNIDSAHPLMAVVGHEMLHKLRDSDEAAYRELNLALRKLLTGEGDTATTSSGTTRRVA